MRHRLPRAPNRQFNRVLHTRPAFSAATRPPGRDHYERKRAGKAPMEAMPCVSRRLSDGVFQNMLDDAVRGTTESEDELGRTTGTRL